MATIEEAMASAKSAHHRLDGLESEVKDIRGLTQAMVATATNVENLKEDVTEIKSDIKNITQRPAKMWDKVIGGIIGAIAAGIAAAVLALILK